MSIANLAAQNLSVAQARAVLPGTAVQVRGVVLNGPELGKIRYLQDASAGIALYPGAGSMPGFEAAVAQGDSLEVSGYLTDFNGLLEISPVLAYSVLTRNCPLPAPKPVRLAGLNENLESQLLSVDCLSFSGPAAVFSGAGAFPVSDAAGQESEIYLRNTSPLLGLPVPQQPLQMTAILSQYGDYQLLPRTAADFSPASCLHLLEQPRQADIAPHSFRLSWATSAPASAVVFFGTQPGQLQWSVPVVAAASEQTQVLDGLQPGTVYWVQVAAVVQADTVFSGTRPFVTQSASSGQVKLYFNQGIDSAAANGLVPAGQSYAEVLAETLARIQTAQSTIDVAMYNTTRSDLVTALAQAHLRGVRVRFIAAANADNPALSPPPVFPVLFGNDAALMHNKFMVIDAGSPEQAWVMGGSMNWSVGNMIQDPNNTLFIQDQSLARAYELEFEEMWGSSGPAPSPANSRFGSAKTDNTPHQFVIGGRPVELYFSPSDQTTQQITRAIQNAQFQASFCIFSFTKNEIGAAFAAEHQIGTWVRGMIENINDPGEEYSVLLNAGVPVKAHAAPALLHHKYAVLDAGHPASDPTVVTGSHNWTQAAESNNDENTLILHDASIAALYQAEFERRWVETGTAVVEIAGTAFEVYPNPASDRLFIRCRDSGTPSLTFEIRDMSGKPLHAGLLPGSGTWIQLPDALPAGGYVLILRAAGAVVAVPLQVVGG